MSKISITPIGTCRINTPLRRGAARYPIEINASRVYGFVHTTEEALQQLEFLLGERNFEPDVLPILFRPLDQEAIAKRVWHPSDIHFVEVSSAKSYRVGETAVQSNYLSRYFADFFASVPRTRRFWSLAGRADRVSRTELAAFLKSDPVFNLYSKSDQALLASISMRTQGFDEILQDMGSIVERLGAGKVVFVTHVNAMTPDGAVIPSRDKLIRWVNLACERLGVPCFDPTAMMREFGQERAMEREGLDTTHYTDHFADRWYTHVHREFVLPRILDAGLDADLGEAGSPSLMAESIAAAIEFDDFYEGARQLFAALDDHPVDPTLLQLSGKVYERLGDFQSVIRSLKPIAESPDLTVPSLITLMRANFQAGEAQAAIEIADRLLEDEHETIEVYELASLAAEGLGRAEDAMRYAKLAFRLDQSQHRFATRVLDHYVASGQRDQLKIWQNEVFDRLEARPDMLLARALVEWSIVHRDETTFRTAIMVVAHNEMRSVERLVEEAVGQGMLLAASEVIVAIAALPNVNSNVMRNFRALAEQWPARSAAMLQEGQIGDAFALASACQALLPKNKDAVRVERNVILHLRDTIRTAQAQGDHQAVVALGEGAGRMLYRRYEIAAAYARSLLATGRGEEALEVALQSRAAFPDNVDLMGLSAQVAASLGNIGLGLQLYGELRLSTDPVAERYRERGERFFDKAERIGLRQVRALVDAGDFEKAIELCGLLTRYTAAQERVAVELIKLRRALRVRLRQLDEEEDTAGEPMRIVKLMLDIVPDEASTLRRAALESMKIQDFKSALVFWRELDRVAPGQESTANSINRCQIFAQRHAEQEIRDGKHAFRLDHTQHALALRVLDYYLAAGEADLLQSWQNEILDRLAVNSDAPLARALVEWSIARCNTSMFSAAILIVAREDIRIAGRLVDDAASQGMADAAVEAVAAIAAAAPSGDDVWSSFRARAEQWPARSTAMLADGRFADAFALASACQALLPRSKEARRVERDAVLQFRDAIRVAQTQGDHQAVVAMGEGAGQLLNRRPEIVTAYARSLLVTGRGQEALAIALQGREAYPDNIELLGLSAQIAVTLDDLGLGLQLYGELRLSTDPAAERYRERGARFFDKAERTGPRTVRALVNSGDFEKAIKLSRLVNQHTSAHERISAELLKLRRVLRVQLRQIESDEGARDEVMRILKLILEITPDDPSTLRRAALESMKRLDFERALDFWRELDRVSPGLESTANSINRCHIYAQRQVARAGGARTAIAA